MIDEFMGKHGPFRCFADSLNDSATAGRGKNDPEPQRLNLCGTAAKRQQNFGRVDGDEVLKG
jgi:hypothetical protein